MLYADISNVGTCCMLRVALLFPVWLSRLTSHWALTCASIRGWLAAVPRCFSFEMAHTSKTSCSNILFETESNGSREDHSLLFLWVTQCPTVVPCFWKVLLLCNFRFVPYISLNFHVQGGLLTFIHWLKVGELQLFVVETWMYVQL